MRLWHPWQPVSGLSTDKRHCSSKFPEKWWGFTDASTVRSFPMEKPANFRPFSFFCRQLQAKCLTLRSLNTMVGWKFGGNPVPILSFDRTGQEVFNKYHPTRAFGMFDVFVYSEGVNDWNWGLGVTNEFNLRHFFIPECACFFLRKEVQILCLLAILRNYLKKGTVKDN